MCTLLGSPRIGQRQEKLVTDRNLPDYYHAPVPSTIPTIRGDTRMKGALIVEINKFWGSGNVGWRTIGWPRRAAREFRVQRSKKIGDAPRILLVLLIPQYLLI